jgi:hypothetical protein
MESLLLNSDHDAPIGDLTLLPPEVLERVLGLMNPLHLVPVMLSCSTLNSLAHNERIWDKVYKRVMSETHKALHLAPNPDYWRFRNPSSIKFVFEFVKTRHNALSYRDEVCTVMEVMKANKGSALIQRAAVYILRRLAYYPQVCDKPYREKIEVYRSALGREGAIEAAVSVLQRFEEPDLLAGALCALGNLVIDPDNAQMLHDMKGIEGIVDAISRHLESFVVLDYGCFALCNIGDDYKYKEAIVAAGGGQLALEALKSSKYSPEELVPPVDLLSVLCQVAECKATIGQQIVTAIDGLLDRANSCPKLMAHLLTLAVLVCENAAENRDRAVELSVIDKVFVSLQTYEKDTSIFVKASLVLFTLFWRNDRPSMASHRFRLIDAVVNAMKASQRDIPLQRTSAAMLSDFAHSDPTLKTYIVGLGGKELVRFALSSADDTDPEWNSLAGFISIDD